MLNEVAMFASRDASLITESHISLESTACTYCKRKNTVAKESILKSHQNNLAFNPDVTSQNPERYGTPWAVHLYG